MEPANTIISALGGPTAVARLTGVHRTRVSGWKRPKEKGGTGGRIPLQHINTMLNEARRQGLAINAEDFLRFNVE